MWPVMSLYSFHPFDGRIDFHNARIADEVSF